MTYFTMFDSLKEKLASVSKNVLSFSSSKNEEPLEKPFVNYNAGTSILNHFHQQWEELHSLNEENAKLAASLAETIENVYDGIKCEHKSICDITQILTSAPSLTKNVEVCVTNLVQLEQTFEKVEDSLLKLEDLIENLELQEKQLEHRFQLALYKEKKLANLEAVRVTLAAKHAQSVMEHELKQQQVSQERQQAFQEAFQNDLQAYRQEGVLPKTDSPKPAGALLEEIQLNCDSEELQKFLEN